MLKAPETSGTGSISTTYNANRPHGFGVLDPDAFSPYPKNPVIGAFFRQIDRADELGSGMRNMMKYGRKYGGAGPQVIEGDIFQMIVSVPEFGKETKPVGVPELEAPVKAPVKAPVPTTGTAADIISALATEPLGRAALLDRLGYSQPTGNYKKAVRKLLDNGLVEMTIPDKPNSRRQRYRLTARGEAVRRQLGQMENGA
jgi:ATP-dependent DNA helicase RecG